MNKRHTNILAYILTFVGGLIVSLIFVFCALKSKENDVKIKIETDTIYITKVDTIHHTKIIKQEKYHYDTIVVNDTVYIRDIPQTYTDSCEDYKIDINAVKLYDYNLDIYKVDTFIQVKEKVSQIERKRGFGWSINAGIQIGYGANINPSNMRVNFSPYIGFGVGIGFGYSWK